MVAASVVPAVLAVTALVGAIVTALSWRHRRRPGGYPLVVLMVAVTWWTMAYIGEVTATSIQVKLLWAKLQWFGSVWVPVAWLLFALEFTGYDDFVTPRRVLALSAIPALSILLVWTNASHGLIRQDVTVVARDGLRLLAQSWGPGFWLAIGYTYLLAFVGSFLLLRLALRSTGLFRDQIAAMLVAALAPWISNLLYVSNVDILWGVDPTPIAFTVSGLASLGAITRFRLLRVSTVPRRLVGELVLSGMEDGVVVVDTDGRIVDLNPAARRVVGDGDIVGVQASEVVPGYDDGMGWREDIRTVVAVGDDTRERFFDVRRSQLTDHHGRSIGTVVVLRDVTEGRRHQQRLDVLNRVLRHNLRNEMNVLTGYADRVRSGDIEADRFARIVEDRAAEIVELGDKARTIEELLEDDSSHVDVNETLERVVDRLAAEYPSVDVSLDGRPPPVWSANWRLEPVIENLVENAAEHNRRDDAWVRIGATVEDARLTVRIEDNGPGLPAVERSVLENLSETQTQHGRGLGLWLANWGVGELGGHLSFEERSPRGTVVRVELPVDRRSLPAPESDDAPAPEQALPEGSP